VRRDTPRDIAKEGAAGARRSRVRDRSIESVRWAGPTATGSEKARRLRNCCWAGTLGVCLIFSGRYRADPRSFTGRIGPK
jgi:hypothetical protein